MNEICCPKGQDAYSPDGSYGSCCNGVAQCITHEGKQVCRCCPDGETLYSYYSFRQYDAEGNITASIPEVSCCTNNPMTSPMSTSTRKHDDGSLSPASEHPLCCHNSAPFADMYFEDSNGNMGVLCVSDKYNMTTYETRDENYWDNYYSYCPDGAGSWHYIDSTEDGAFYMRERNCL